MPVIDKRMYKELKKWWYCTGPYGKDLIYVNSNDRVLTDSTIRKMMYEIDKEDKYGDLFISLYSAENFYYNMRDYFTHVAELKCLEKPTDDQPIEDIIESIQTPCGWIILIIEDIDSLYEAYGKLEEMMKYILSFALRSPYIILTWNEDHESFFSVYEHALQEISNGDTATDDDDPISMGIYDQENESLEIDIVAFDSPDDQRDELDYYWHLVYEQLINKYLDYVNYKSLYKDTLDYLIPRMTKEYVYRSDVKLIEDIARISRKEPDDIDGCMPWELDAAKEFSRSLNEAIIYNHDVNRESEIELHIVVEDPPKEHENSICSYGYSCMSVNISVDNVIQEIDRIAGLIHECTYKGNFREVLKYMQGIR